MRLSKKFECSIFIIFCCNKNKYLQAIGIIWDRLFVFVGVRSPEFTL